MPQVERLFIEHVSNRPDPSKMRPPERIYAALWQTWQREGLVSLPLARPAMTQEDAMVAAGIIQFLGTKGGILLLNRVWKDSKKMQSERAWLKEFKRFTTEWLPQVNKGFTSFELCLAPAWTDQQHDHAVTCRPRDPSLARAATKRELQVARAVFRWLATIPGHTFVDEGEFLIKAQKAHESAVHHYRVNKMFHAGKAKAS
jgi:hypothetical protein